MYHFDYCVFQYSNFLYDIAPSGLGTSGGAAVLERGVLRDGGCWHEERVPPEGPDLALASQLGTCVPHRRLSDRSPPRYVWTTASPTCEPAQGVRE